MKNTEVHDSLVCALIICMQMGSLTGHVLPGCFALLLGFSWMVLSLWAYLSKKLQLYHNQPTMYTESELERKSYIPMPFCRNIPIESISKIFLPGLAIIMECFFFVDRDENGYEHVWVGVYSVYGEDGHLRDQGKFHHLTIHLFFVTSGLVDLLSLYIRYPKHTSKLFLGFAMLVEGVVFLFHLGERSLFNVTLHQLLILVVFTNASFAFLRMHKSANLLINAGFGFCATLQGTWLIHMGVALYGKQPLDEENSQHFSSAFMVGCFFLHFLLIVVFMLILYTVLSLYLSYLARRKKTLFQSLKCSDETERDILLKSLSQEQAAA